MQWLQLGTTRRAFLLDLPKLCAEAPAERGLEVGVEVVDRGEHARVGAVAPVVVEPLQRDEAPKTDRAEVFAAWLDETFGRERLATVVDVAGGKGAVAAALLRRGASRKATVIDPVGLDRNHAGEVKQASVDDAFSEAVKLLREPFAYPPSPTAKALLEEATCVASTSSFPLLRPLRRLSPRTIERWLSSGRYPSVSSSYARTWSRRYGCDSARRAIGSLLRAQAPNILRLVSGPCAWPRCRPPSVRSWRLPSLPPALRVGRFGPPPRPVSYTHLTLPTILLV